MRVRFEMHALVGVATLDDVPKRNALSRSIVRDMFGVLETFERSNGRALVVTGAGPTFCAGANIADLRDGWMEGDDPSTDPMRLFQALAELPRIVIAALNGPAVGGGFELMLSCDLAVANHSAWLALPELGHGVIPNTALARLPQVIGFRRALDLVLTRRRVSMEEALALGLVTEITEGDPIERAIAMARDIVSNTPPGALAIAKASVHAHATTDWTRVRTSLQQVPPAEWREGLDAFAARRGVDFERFWDAASGTEAGSL